MKNLSSLGAERREPWDLKTSSPRTHTINVEGMHCPACEKLVSTALEDRGATNVVANHETGVVEYEGELDSSLISEAIAEAGFELA